MCIFSSYACALLVFLTFTPLNIASWNNSYSSPHSSDSNNISIITHTNSVSQKSQRFLTWTEEAVSNSIHLVFTAAAHSMLYESFLSSTNASHILMCTSTLCPSRFCHACIANISVTPPSNMATALKIIRNLKIGNLVLLYDETAFQSMWSLSKFMSDISFAHVFHLSLRVDLSRQSEMEKLRRILRSVQSEKTHMYRHFIVICKEATTQKILREIVKIAPKKGLLSRQYFWIILSPITDTASLLHQLPPYANVLIMFNEKPECSHSLSNRESVINLVRQVASSCSMFDTSCFNNIRHALQNCSSSGTLVQLVSSITNETHEGLVTKWKRVATYSTVNNSLITTTSLFPNTFVDFAGSTLKMGANLITPYVIATGRTFVIKNVTCHELEGVYIDVVNILSERLNFRPCYLYPSDKLWGDYNESTGISTGLIGMAHHNEVDFVASCLAVSHSRAKAIDYSFPIISVSQGIIIRRQERPKSVVKFLRPFEWSVWMALCCALLITAIFKSIFSKISPLNGKSVLQKAVNNEAQVNQSVWNILSHILRQGTENTPFSISGRLLTIFLCFFSVVISTHYSANLYTILSLQDRKLPIESVEDLASQTDIRLILKNGTYLDNLFKSSRDMMIQSVNQKAVRYNMDSDEILAMIRNSSNGNLAFAWSHRMLRGYEAQDCDAFAVLPELFLKGLTAAYVWPKNSFFADKVNALLQTIVQSGYVEKRFDFWFKKLYGKPCPQQADKNAKFSPTVWADMSSMLTFCIILMIIASVFFSFEFFIRRPLARFK